jgi:hypothetical protein
MKKAVGLLGLLAIALLALLPTGCQLNSRASDEEDIRTVLGTSDYTNDDHSGTTDDGTNQPKRDVLAPGGAFPLSETLPWVRFVRMIDRPVTRTITIEIPAPGQTSDTTALATVTARPTGTFYVHNDRTSHIAWAKPLADEGVRKVYLTRHERKWLIRAMTPWDLTTVDAPYGIAISSIRIEARPSGLNYEYTSPDTMLTKQALPVFLPSDTVKVTVTVASDSGTWAFLHRGREGHHKRDAFYQASSNVFEREWTIPDDSIPQRPCIRPTAIDIIGYPTLFGDSLSAYNSRAWTLPYIVLDRPDAVRPE